MDDFLVNVCYFITIFAQKIMAEFVKPAVFFMAMIVKKLIKINQLCHYYDPFCLLMTALVG